jgi:hypothetical protein
MRLNPASRKYTLECIRDLTVPGTACVWRSNSQLGPKKEALLQNS